MRAEFEAPAAAPALNPNPEAEVYTQEQLQSGDYTRSSLKGFVESGKGLVDRFGQNFGDGVQSKITDRLERVGDAESEVDSDPGAVEGETNRER